MTLPAIDRCPRSPRGSVLGRGLAWLLELGNNQVPSPRHLGHPRLRPVWGQSWPWAWGPRPAPAPFVAWHADLLWDGQRRGPWQTGASLALTSHLSFAPPCVNCPLLGADGSQMKGLGHAACY